MGEYIMYQRARTQLNIVWMCANKKDSFSVKVHFSFYHKGY